MYHRFKPNTCQVFQSHVASRQYFACFVHLCYHAKGTAGFFDHHVFVFTSFQHLWQRDNSPEVFGQRDLSMVVDASSGSLLTTLSQRHGGLQRPHITWGIRNFDSGGRCLGEDGWCKVLNVLLVLVGSPWTIHVYNVYRIFGL